MRSNNLRETSPDRGLAAAARLATCNPGTGEGAVERRRLSASGPGDRGTAERCRRHSYHSATTLPGSGSPPPPLRHAWRFTAANGSAQGDTTPTARTSGDTEGSPPQSSRQVPEPAGADIAAGVAATFSPPSARRGVRASTTFDEKTHGGEEPGPSFSFAPSPKSAATETATPMLARPRRLVRAHSALRTDRRAEPQRAHSADPRRRKDTETSIDDGRQEDPPATCRRGSGNTRTSDACLPTARDAGGAVRERRDQPGGLTGSSSLALSPSLRRQAPFKALQSGAFGGKYHAGRYLGRGASATVWEASHSESSLRVAVKVFDQGSRDKRQAHREVRVLSRVQHPSILEAYEVIESTLYAQLVCELVDGESLRAFAQRQPGHRLLEGPARRFYQQVVDGISYCHERLVVHRDLKLENLLLDKGGDRVKIIDFGFATQVASKDTKLRAFCGTPSYMAPEIVRGEGYSGFATDVWAIGVVLFALLAGALPFVGRTEMQLYAKIRRGSFVCPDILVDPPRRLVKSMLRMETLARPTAAAVLRQPWVAGEARAHDEVACHSPGRGCKNVDQQGAVHERARLVGGSHARKDRSESPSIARRRLSGRGVVSPTTALGGS